MDQFTQTFAYEEEHDADIRLVRVVQGPDAGAQASFSSSKRVLVGSGPTTDLRLTDPTVSRLHCELVAEDAGVRLRDLGSKNGCWLADTRIVEALLTGQTRIRVGATSIETLLTRGLARRAVWSGGDSFYGLVGGSNLMHQLFAMAAQVASTQQPLLIRGESGTGKEVLARAIHDHSPSKEGPFVVLDCAALSRNLADVDLFGHAKGAFTGAEISRMSIFERADQGTLFVDEIGELPLELQPKLLRVLETGDVQRIGDSTRRQVEMRIIAASHASLEHMVNAGSFREDLFFRLCGVELQIPPLRSRGQDVLLLARHLTHLARPGDKVALENVERELNKRESYPWPGNVRELRNFVRRVSALGFDLDPLAGRNLPVTPTVRADLPFRAAKQQWVNAFEALYLSQLIDETGANISKAARQAELHRSSLYEMLDRQGLDPRKR